MKTRSLRSLAAAAAIFALAAGGARAEEKKMQITGYVQEMFRSVSNHNYPNSTSYSMRLARLVFSGKHNDNWSYSFQLDASQQPTLLDAYLDFTHDKVIPEPFAFSMRAGQFRMPFSMENLAGDATLDTINRSQVVNRLSPGRDVGTKGRDVGIALQLTASPWNIKKFAELTVGQCNGEGANLTDKNNQKGVAMRGVINPISFLSWGVSYYDGSLYSTSSAMNRFGTELTLTMDRAYLKGEYINGKLPSTGNAQPKNAYGWYLQSAYFVLPKVLQAVAKYDVYDPNWDAASDKLTTTTAGVNWYFTDGMRLQTNYEWVYSQTVGLSNNVFSTVLAMTF